MIDELHVKNVALIQEATLSPAQGLTVVTGETGAGKTALLSALKLLVGERADAHMVREGASSLSVEGRFYTPSSNEAEGVVVSRTLSADGRSRVHVDGSISSVQQLAHTVGASVDLCGQHEHQRLRVAANHRKMLDAWMGSSLSQPMEAYAQAWRAANEAASVLRAVREAGNMSNEEVDQARYVVTRIGEVNPMPGEYEELLASVPRAENAEQLMMSVSGAYQALSGEGGALDALSQAAGLLERVSGVDESLGALAESLREASYVVEDVSRDTRAYRDDLEYSPVNLAEMQERLGELQGLMRTWGPGMEQVFEAREAALQALAAYDSLDERLREAQAEVQAAEEALARAASALHDARASAAPQFAEAVSAQMGRLEMNGATLECGVTQLPRESWTAQGPDAVEFLFKPGANMSARPLGKIASGGETSRVMLAIKVVMGSRDDVETLVFDEVDAGVGGSAARALADVLVDLSKTHQVIVVTHLAQVAVAGACHYVVSKTGGSEPSTQLEPVSGTSRVREIARMLSGDASSMSMEHARALLQERA
ncbi:DNA repair protein RecN [Denitrobacterium detoxificans]|jgi:DNA repair protein RecN (Recombination protein N)|uniref:DNA repair protein RecN n=1 Tax=Denitrobacterium detoxificans TaxID=79604 RepID=UPI0026EF3E62|nr:DNA repair protein RecN [Denitrobacterium detoxificans]MBE6465431.1 DNA repair protein RecN [Denitrobacterium detoxificans]